MTKVHKLRPVPQENGNDRVLKLSCTIERIQAIANAAWGLLQSEPSQQAQQALLLIDTIEELCRLAGGAA